jgi:ubiquinone/menaquinone biosynthesis C-methylase UbiE
MKSQLVDIYRCPVTHAPLALTGGGSDAEVESGELAAGSGRTYPIRDGVPVFVPEDLLTDEERETQSEYDASAAEKYDSAVDWQFRVFYEDEDSVREQMVDLLRLGPDAKVLEIGCGTGRDSFRIARRLENGRFFVQDLSEQMVLKARERVTRDVGEGVGAELSFFVSTARFLPFADGYFDAVFHFGGFNNFSEPARTLAEITRVVRDGGRVVFGDEAVPPWLRDTDFGRMLIENNPLFGNELRLEHLPANAREVAVRWVIGGCFYLVDYTVGDGPPPVDIDLPHKGWRGGTIRTRYYGRLEGVTPEARELAIRAAREQGVSVHEWLEDLVRRNAPAGDGPAS